jgi:hypothetical protein
VVDFLLVPLVGISQCSPYPNTVLMATFTAFDTESCCDHLTLRDGSSTSANQLAYLFGLMNTALPGPFYSSTRSVRPCSCSVSPALHFLPRLSVTSENLHPTHPAAAVRVVYDGLLHNCFGVYAPSDPRLRSRVLCVPGARTLQRLS